MLFRSDDPAQIRIHALGDVTLDYGGTLTAVVETNGAFSATGTFAGTWIGSSLTTNWGGQLHVDEAQLCP